MIGSTPVGDGLPCYLIAEAGVNHNGDPEIARALIDRAAEVKASAVKFQKRTIPEILVRSALEKPYLSSTALGPTYGEHREKLELSEAVYYKLFAAAAERGIHFLASGWDKTAVDFLDSLGVPAFKAASADVTNLPLLEHIARKSKPVILSTGMSSVEEIDEAVETVLAHNENLILLHCVSTYPSPNDSINLRVMETLRRRYNLPIGYSGHERGIAISVAARALGAVVIERHFTLDRAMRGPDHAASLEVAGLQKLVQYVRTVEQALGSAEKGIQSDEAPMRNKLAKSVASAARIPAGAVISAAMLTIKGPGDGLKPKYLRALIGKIAQQDIEADTLIPPEALHW